MSSSKTYEISGETTEWDEILIKKGITTKEEVLYKKGLNPLDFMDAKDLKEVNIIDAYEITLEDKLNVATLDELDELDEDDEFADTNMLDEYRANRLLQLKEAQARNRFGEVLEIVKDDWIREVTECSNSCWVIAHLYQDSMIECNIMEEALMKLAPKFKYVKFVKIRSTQAVENWPDKRCPTLFLYHDGELKLQSFTLTQFGGKTMKADDLEWWLSVQNVINDSELDEDPRKKANAGKQVKTLFRGNMSSLGSDDEDGSSEDEYSGRGKRR